MTTRFIYPAIVLSWQSLETEDGQKLRPSGKMNAVGFIPVYTSIQALVEDHGPDIDSGTFVSESDWPKE